MERVLAIPIVNWPQAQEISDDARLVVAARDGNRTCVRTACTKNMAAWSTGFCWLVSRGPEVDDLVQDVFLLAMRRLPTLREAGAFGGWLAMIARNRATDYHRSAPALMELHDDAVTQAAPRPEAMADSGDDPAIARGLPRDADICAWWKE